MENSIAVSVTKLIPDVALAIPFAIFGVAFCTTIAIVVVVFEAVQVFVAGSVAKECGVYTTGSVAKGNLTRGATIAFVIVQLGALEDRVAISVTEFVPDVVLACSGAILGVALCAAITAVIVVFITVQVFVADSIAEQGGVDASGGVTKCDLARWATVPLIKIQFSAGEDRVAGSVVEFVPDVVLADARTILSVARLTAIALIVIVFGTVQFRVADRIGE